MPPKVVGNDRLKRRQMKEETDEYAKGHTACIISEGM